RAVGDRASCAPARDPCTCRSFRPAACTRSRVHPLQRERRLPQATLRDGALGRARGQGAVVRPSALYAMPKNLVLAARACTGKTHALVGVVVHLLVGGRAGGAVDPSRIVATTFSRKAAAEIRARVMSEVERLAVEPAASVYAAGLREAMGGRVTDAELAKRA